MTSIAGPGPARLFRPAVRLSRRLSGGTARAAGDLVRQAKAPGRYWYLSHE